MLNLIYHNKIYPVPNTMAVFLLCTAIETHGEAGENWFSRFSYYIIDIPVSFTSEALACSTSL